MTTVLAVDDEEAQRMLLVDLLEDLGLHAVEARDGAEAVQKALQSAPSVILMDVGMPVMDGCQAAELLRSRPKTARIPVIACTGHAPAEEWDGLFDAVLRKPFGPAELAQTLAGFVRLQPPR